MASFTKTSTSRKPKASSTNCEDTHEPRERNRDAKRKRDSAQHQGKGAAINKMIEYLTSRDFIILIIKIVVIFGAVMNVVGLLSWVERKVMARVQMRPGPTRVGPFGLLQPLADLLKFVFKEEVIPTQANTFLYIAAPLISLIPAFLTFAVVPFGPWLQVTDLSVGLLFVFALTSLGVYGIALGGWSSNSKYPLLGAMRSSAQMISYELSLTLSVIGVLLIANTLSLRELVISQNSTWAGFIPRWNIFLQPIAFVVYVVSGVAETNRLPFDLAESEQELVAGWHTEYSSMKFLMFMMAEYANLIGVSSVATILFLGGWNGPMFGPQWLQMVLPIVWFVLKIGLFVFFYVLLRSTIPRFRYDQLMRFGWKVLLPLSLANIVVTSFVIAIT
jgi:NADH-quinone oxidoreductase subunit H